MTSIAHEARRELPAVAARDAWLADRSRGERDTRLVPLLIGLAVVPLVAASFVLLDTRIAVLASVAAVAVAVGAASLVRPDIATVVGLGLIYSNAAVVAAQFHGVPYLVPALVPALLLVPLVDRLVFHRERLVTPPTMAFLGLYLIVQITSTFVSRDPTAALEELTRFLSEGVLLYILVVNAVRSRQILLASIVTIVAFATVIASLTIYQQATGSYDNDFFGFAQARSRGFATEETVLGRVVQPRSEGPIGEQNFYAQTLLAAVPLAILLARVAPHPAARVAAGLAGIVMLGGIALTFSRGAAFALVLLIPVMLWLRVIALRGVLALALAGCLLVVLVPNYLTRLQSLEGFAGAVEASSETDPVIAQRANDMLSAGAAFLDHPILGVGPGLFPSYYQEYASRVGGLPGRLEYAAHSLYFEIPAETGFLGIVGFGGIVATTLWLLISARRRASRPDLVAIADAFILVVVGYLATGIFLHISYQRFIWMFFALAAAAALVVRAESAITAPGKPTTRTDAIDRAERPRSSAPPIVLEKGAHP